MEELISYILSENAFFFGDIFTDNLLIIFIMFLWQPDPSEDKSEWVTWFLDDAPPSLIAKFEPRLRTRKVAELV